ncbi:MULTISPECIES: alpha/beta fold hydrolase [unclassified Beijerinckia]|uniref:alpha/beta hydrolase family protein n=1 Tax=unclassified Beijerinckia TaxID=2638183 RepID=UPI00089D6159|nr:MULTISPECIES: alpha/beta fold hydrolase [unclassified Beijerinckia]MDH7796212.1 dienelactone hydrolase [Beijerinckia sp. GAS462]SEC35293.1 Prolyl oligopeptidase family protein [Beijerinckia sp. 28-YEA-48]
MFEYFDGNYPWNSATVMVLNTGAQIAEVDDVLSPIKHLAAGATDQANEAFCQAWQNAAQKVEGFAEADEALGNLRAAGGKYARAAGYYFAAERQTSVKDPNRLALYRNMLHAFTKYVALRREPCERVEIPFDNGTSLPALYVRGKGAVARKPCIVHFDGLDVNKEWIYLSGMPHELAERGVSTLIVDHPGVGEALRLRGLKSIVEIERAASASVDWLITQSDVDPERIGMMAPSLGGYYAMRSAAHEPRFRCVVAWGAMYDFGAGVRRRLAGNGTQKSVHHFFDHVQWVTGASNLEEALRIADQMTLKGILDRIRCPMLVVHGENDRQVSLDAAKQVYAEAINSVKKELKVHTLAEGGSEHCSIDNMSLSIDYIAHWIARTLDAPKELA